MKPKFLLIFLVLISFLIQKIFAQVDSSVPPSDFFWLAKICYLDYYTDTIKIRTVKNIFLQLKKEEKFEKLDEKQLKDIYFQANNDTSLFAQSFKKGVLLADLTFFQVFEDKKNIGKIKKHLKSLKHKNLPDLDFLDKLLEDLRNYEYKFEKKHLFLEDDLVKNQILHFYVISLLGHFVESMYLESVFLEIYGNNKPLSENVFWHLQQIELLYFVCETLRLQKKGEYLRKDLDKITKIFYDFFQQNLTCLKASKKDKHNINNKTLQNLIQNIKILRNKLLEVK